MDKLSLTSEETTDILVVDTAYLGDIVTMEPALRALKRNFPNAEIDALTNPISAEVLKTQPDVRRVIEWDKSGSGRSVTGMFRLLGRMDADYNAAFIFHNSFGSALPPFLRGIPVRVGYTTELRSVFLSHGVPQPDTELHLIDSRLHLLEEAGVELDGIDRDPALELDRGRAQEWFREHMPADYERRKTVLIPVSAGYYTKTWPAQNIQDFLNLFPVNSINAVLTGTGEDRDRAEQIYSYNNPLIDLVGKTSVRELLYAVACSDLVVSPDTGPMHMAAALDVPVVALFGPTDPELCGARGDRVTILQADLKCIKCYKKDCNFNPFCMRDSLTPELVYFHAAQEIGLDPVKVADRDVITHQQRTREAGAL